MLKERFKLARRRSFLTMRTAQQQSKLPRDVMQSLSLLIFNTSLGKAPRNLV